MVQLWRKRVTTRSVLAGLVAGILSLTFAGELQAGDGWRDGEPMITARSHAGAALLGDDFYVVGGDSTSGPLSLTEIYDMKGNIWRASAALPVGLQQFGMASSAGKLYVAGGLQAGEAEGEPAHATSKVWILDPRIGTWTDGPRLPDARSDLGLVNVGDKLYALGGQGENAEQVYMYDPALDKWQVVGSPMPVARSGAAYVASGKSIYAIGGRIGGTASARVDVFDTASGTWRAAASLPEARAGHVAALVNGRIHVTGGESLSPPKTYADHFVLDAQGKGWTRLAALHVPRHGSVAGAYGNQFVVIGGSPGAGVYTVFTQSDTVDIYDAGGGK